VQGERVNVGWVLKSLTVAFLACLVVAAPAQAVVGGKSVRPSAAPWFAAVGICGGTLIAPDRVATAAHCVDPIDMSDFEQVMVGGKSRRGIRVALPASWREQRTGFAADDVAIVQLDRPVTGVRPVPLLEPGTRVPARLRILGRGKTSPKGATGHTGLHEATLKTVGDADCTRRWRKSKSKYDKRFEAVSEVCAIDANGRAPLDSVCAGDSGGPMIAGSLARPVLAGIISWTGERCGADRLPTVGAEASHFRDFLTAPEPVWAPLPSGPTRITRAGDVLTCEPAPWTIAPERIDFRWERRTRTKDGYRFTRVGTAQTYTVKSADSGKLISCQALGSGPGGRTTTPFGPDGSIRIS
jgi:secreted trypsin-like serine protease